MLRLHGDNPRLHLLIRQRAAADERDVLFHFRRGDAGRLEDPGGQIFGALLQLDEHGRLALDTLSVERRGGTLLVFINGRIITELFVDRRVSDGQLFIASGLTAADIASMQKTWRQIDAKKRK